MQWVLTAVIFCRNSMAGAETAVRRQRNRGRKRRRRITKPFAKIRIYITGLSVMAGSSIPIWRESHGTKAVGICRRAIIFC